MERLSAERTLGVISDTHGLLRPQVLDALRGVDHIVHAGDIGGTEILDELRGLAPLTAVRGNVDLQPWVRALRETEVIDLGSVAIYVLHDLGRLDIDPAKAGFSAVISGHSHRPSLEKRNGVVFLNPGSAGPRRFNLPVSLARIRVRGDSLNARLIDLTL